MNTLKHIFSLSAMRKAPFALLIMALVAYGPAVSSMLSTADAAPVQIQAQELGQLQGGFDAAKSILGAAASVVGALVAIGGYYGISALVTEGLTSMGLFGIFPPIALVGGLIAVGVGFFWLYKGFTTDKD